MSNSFDWRECALGSIKDLLSPGLPGKLMVDFVSGRVVTVDGDLIISRVEIENLTQKEIGQIMTDRIAKIKAKQNA